MELARDWRGEPEAPPRDEALDDARGEERQPARVRAAVARAADVAGALALIVVGAPLILTGAAAVLASGGRPIFFGHVRVGRRGRLFRCWKLRTMHTDAEARLHADPELHQRYLRSGYKLPSAQDPRVTSVGRWLRRSYVDELPQLWNVLRGDMSLIGPRPELPEIVSAYRAWQHRRHAVRPGMTGWWQVNRDGSRPMHEATELDLYYVDHRSWRLDAVILVRTVKVVIRGTGAF